MKALGPVLAASILGWTAGCAGHDDGREAEVPPEENVVATAPPEKPEVDPEPEPEPAAASVTVSVASVQLQDDCPEKAAPSKPAPAQGASSRSMPKPSMIEPSEPEPAGDMEPGRRAYPPPCVQSRVQIAIESEAETALPFSIRAARLKNPDDGKALGEMTTRGPQVWEQSKYETWDQSIPAGASIKVGYALGAPDWSKIDKVLGDSWGTLYVVELEVEIDGEVRTIVSPKIPRDEPENIVT